MTPRHHPTPPSATRRPPSNAPHRSGPRATVPKGEARSAYLTAFHASVLVTLKKNPSPSVRAAANDVAGFGVARLLRERFEHKLARHHDPVQYGRTAAINLYHDWLRREAVQRGQGARRTTVVVSGGAMDEFDFVDASVDGADTAVMRADIDRLVRVIRRYVSARDWDVFWRVHYDGWTTVQVANHCGLRRETISRIIHDVSETLSMVLA